MNEMPKFIEYCLYALMGAASLIFVDVAIHLTVSLILDIRDNFLEEEEDEEGEE